MYFFEDMLNVSMFMYGIWGISISYEQRLKKLINERPDYAKIYELMQIMAWLRV